MKKRIVFLLSLILCLVGCHTPESKEDQENLPVKIVSLNGAISEILVQLGLEENLVGVDVTSTYPSSLSALPQLGHSRNLSVEGLLSTLPDVVVSIKGSLAPEKVQQIQEAGIRLEQLDQEFSEEGLYTLIDRVAALFQAEEKGASLKKSIQAKMKDLDANKNWGRVLFIYARGAGNLMVAGAETPAEAFIELAGGTNAAEGFEGFKPLTAEALLLADPDCFLMFESGLNSLEGPKGLLSIPGVSETKAGKSEHILTMDGQLMLGFGPRLPEALAEIQSKIPLDSLETKL